MTETHNATRFFLIRHGESNPASDGSKGPDYQLTARGAEQVAKVGRNLPEIIGLTATGRLPLMKFAHDGTTRSRETLTSVIGNAGLPGSLLPAGELQRKDLSPREIREQVTGWFTELRGRGLSALSLLDTLEVDSETRGALSGLVVVVAASHRTISSVVAPQLGVPDGEIESEILIEGTQQFTEPTPYIPFASITELELGDSGLYVVHAGLTVEQAVDYAKRRNVFAAPKRPHYGKPVSDDKPVVGRRYVGSHEI